MGAAFSGTPASISAALSASGDRPIREVLFMPLLIDDRSGEAASFLPRRGTLHPARRVNAVERLPDAIQQIGVVRRGSALGDTGDDDLHAAAHDIGETRLIGGVLHPRASRAIVFSCEELDPHGANLRGDRSAALVLVTRNDLHLAFRFA